MRSCPSQQLPAVECYYMLHIHILHIIMTMCPSRGWRTEDGAVGGGRATAGLHRGWAPSPSQGLFRRLCRYQVHRYTISTSKEYLQTVDVLTCLLSQIEEMCLQR